MKIADRIENNKDLNVHYASNAKYSARIIGDDGKPVGEGQNVEVYIDSKLHSIKTDKEGFITIAIDKNFIYGLVYTIR